MKNKKINPTCFALQDPKTCELLGLKRPQGNFMSDYIAYYTCLFRTEKEAAKYCEGFNGQFVVVKIGIV